MSRVTVGPLAARTVVVAETRTNSVESEVHVYAMELIFRIN